MSGCMTSMCNIASCKCVDVSNFRHAGVNISTETLNGVLKFSLKIPNYSEDLNNKQNQFPQSGNFLPSIMHSRGLERVVSLMTKNSLI